MDNTSRVKSFKQNVNGINFYCELRGSGPSIVLIPSGEGDCESYAKVADGLADEFTVFTLDMRGCSRTGRPPTWTPMTEKDLASDVAGLIKVLDLSPASIYDCSSGGQAVLSIGVYFPEVARNLMVHEAALFDDRTSMRVMEEQMAELVKMKGSKNDAFLSFLFPAAGDEKAWDTMSPEYIERIRKNGDVWFDLILSSVGKRVYTAEELLKMPPLVFSVGLMSLEPPLNPIIQTNLKTAERGNAEVVELPGAHFPQITHPDNLIEHIREQTKKYLKLLAK